MSSRREVFVRILALLQRKTLIETKNRTLECLKRHSSTVRSMKNVAVLTEDGAFALLFRPHPGGFEGSRVRTPRSLPSKANARWVSPGGGGVGSPGIDWCITDPASTQHFSHQFSQDLHLTVLEPGTGYSQIHWPATSFWSSLNDFEYNY